MIALITNWFGIIVLIVYLSWECWHQARCMRILTERLFVADCHARLNEFLFIRGCQEKLWIDTYRKNGD